MKDIYIYIYEKVSVYIMYANVVHFHGIGYKIMWYGYESVCDWKVELCIYVLVINFMFYLLGIFVGLISYVSIFLVFFINTLVPRNMNGI